MSATYLPETEPKIHSHIEDSLPATHPLAFVQVHCDECDELVHAGNNECMQTWFEFVDANVCASCVGELDGVLESNRWRVLRADHP